MRGKKDTLIIYLTKKKINKTELNHYNIDYYIIKLFPKYVTDCMTKFPFVFDFIIKIP